MVYKRAAKGVTSDRVSPYDELIKKYAKELGWDWRMLAAVVYQESKFSINSVSHRGAVGLMQVMPQTGLYYGVEDLTDKHREEPKTDVLNPEDERVCRTDHLFVNKLRDAWPQ